jgi:hypothetical protein
MKVIEVQIGGEISQADKIVYQFKENIKQI